MRILMREEIDISSTITEPIAILPEDNDLLYKVLCNQTSQDKATAIVSEGVWTSKDGCLSYYVEYIEDWRL